LKIVCAWCDKDMGTDDEKGDIRYSVCRDCLAKFNILPAKENGTSTAESRTTPEKPENQKRT